MPKAGERDLSHQLSSPFLQGTLDIHDLGPQSMAEVAPKGQDPPEQQILAKHSCNLKYAFQYFSSSSILQWIVLLIFWATLTHFGDLSMFLRLSNSILTYVKPVPLLRKYYCFSDETQIKFPSATSTPSGVFLKPLDIEYSEFIFQQNFTDKDF